MQLTINMETIKYITKGQVDIYFEKLTGFNFNNDNRFDTLLRIPLQSSIICYFQ